MEGSINKGGDAMAGTALRVLVGAHAYGVLRKEIMHVIDSVDKIPGVPAIVVQSITQAKEEMSAFRAEVDVVIAKLLAWGADAGRAVGAGAAMLMGASAADVANGLGEHRTGRQISDDQASAADLNYHEKVTAAGDKRKEAEARVNFEYATRAEKVAILIKQAEELDRHSESQSISSLASIKDQTEADVRRANAARIRREILNEISKEEDKSLKLSKDRMLIDTPHAERINLLRKEEYDLIEKISALGISDKDKSATQLENEKRLRHELNEVHSRQNKLLDEEQKAWARIGNSIAGSVVNGIEQGKRLRDVWGDVLKSIERDMLRTFTKGLGDKLGSMLNTASTGGGFWGGILSAFTGHAAGGGNINSPTIVGENGPELFIPSGAGSVINNDATRARSGGSGSGGTYYIDARGADRTGMAQLSETIRKLNGSIEARALGAVMNARQRGAMA